MTTATKLLNEEESEKKKDDRRERQNTVYIIGKTLISRNKKEELEEWIRETVDIKMLINTLQKAGCSKTDDFRVSGFRGMNIYLAPPRTSLSF